MSAVYYGGPEPIGYGSLLRKALLFQDFSSVTGLKGFGSMKLENLGNETSSGDTGDDSTSQSRGSPSSGNNLNPVAFVAAAVAALVVVLLALFFIRRRRQRSSDSVSKHRELTDDEDDLGFDTDGEAATPPRKSYILGEDDDTNYSLPRPESTARHGPDEECSSPTCEICEARRQSGTRFLVAENGVEQINSRLPRDSYRNYQANDTVDL